MQKNTARGQAGGDAGKLLFPLKNADGVLQQLSDFQVLGTNFFTFAAFETVGSFATVYGVHFMVIVVGVGVTEYFFVV